MQCTPGRCPPHTNLRCIGWQLHGFYIDCFSLIRVAYEAFLRAIYLSLYPDNTYYSFKSKQKGVRQFQLTNFIKDDLRFEWNEYKNLSTMAHSCEFTALNQIADICKNGQREPICVHFKHEEIYIAVGKNLIYFLHLAFLRFTTVVLLEPFHLWDSDKELASKIIRCTNLWQEYFVSHPDPRWREIAADLDYIFDLVLQHSQGWIGNKSVKS